MPWKEKFVEKGKWRTLEWFVFSEATGFFIGPSGGQVKIRVGYGFLGWNSQKKTLDGSHTKRLHVSSWSAARIQMKVSYSTIVNYAIETGDVLESPPIHF
jgi:hypothetical protein